MKALLLIAFLMMNFAPKAQSLSEKLKARRQASAKKVPQDLRKTMQSGLKALTDLGLHKSALGVGKSVPRVSFQGLDKKRVGIDSLYNSKVTVLTFYRGHWCPYCMLELDAYQSKIALFEKAGAQVVAVSPDTVKEAMKTVKKRKLSFQVLTDPNNRAAKLFGLAFQVDEGTLAVYKKFGINLKKSQGNDENQLPMPGTYVIDKSGVVRYSFVDPDYTKRAEPDDVLKIVRGL